MTVADTLERSPATPRRPGGFRPADAIPFLGALGAAAAVVSLAFLVTPLAGAFGWVLVTYAVFLIAYSAYLRRTEGSVASTDRFATIVIASLGLAALLPLGLLLWYAVSKGVPGLSTNFFTKTLEAVGPPDPATEGGAKNAIIGTLEQVGLATLISTPLGVLTAVYLSEYPGRAARTIRFFVDSMSGIPSIVAGLFIYTMWVLQLHQGFSGLAAAMALAVLMLPTVARASEEMLRLVPGGLRESALALGAPHWRTVVRIVLPTARGGLVTAVLLGVARIAGETAPLLLTAFGSDAVNTNPLHGPQSALPLVAFQRVRNALPSEVERGWTAALVLILLVLVLFTVARLIAARARKVA